MINYNILYTLIKPVGISISEACGGARTRLDEDEFELFNIADLTDDIPYYLKQNNYENTSKCVNVTGTENGSSNKD